MLAKKIIICIMIGLLVSTALPSCRAKSCDTANNIDGDGGGKRKKKDLGLFSKKEKRQRRWR